MKLKQNTRKTQIQKILTKNLLLKDIIKVNKYIAELEGQIEYMLQELDSVTDELEEFLGEVDAGSK